MGLTAWLTLTWGSQPNNMPVFKLQYFDARGIIEPARILLALAGQEFEDGRFPIVFGTPGDPSTIDRTVFEEAKASGALDANLGRAPILYVDGVGIRQRRHADGMHQRLQGRFRQSGPTNDGPRNQE